MIQEEWEESLRQLEVVLSIVIIPFFGKWYGRRFSYWGGCSAFLWSPCLTISYECCRADNSAAFARWQRLGLTRAFFGLT